MMEKKEKTKTGRKKTPVPNPSPEPVTDIPVEAGVHSYGRDEDWVRPTEPDVLDHLEWFRDQKLGLFMHWGLYSQLGMMESWGLCD